MSNASAPPGCKAMNHLLEQITYKCWHEAHYFDVYMLHLDTFKVEVKATKNEVRVRLTPTINRLNLFYTYEG